VLKVKGEPTNERSTYPHKKKKGGLECAEAGDSIHGVLDLGTASAHGMTERKRLKKTTLAEVEGWEKVKGRPYPQENFSWKKREVQNNKRRR